MSDAHRGGWANHLARLLAVAEGRDPGPNPEDYQAYPPAAMPTLAGHDVEVLIADYDSEAIEGSPAPVTVVLRFDSKDAAKAWYESEAYRAIKHLRADNTTGSVVLCDGFVMPT